MFPKKHIWELWSTISLAGAFSENLTCLLALQKVLQLDAHQVDMARETWRQLCQELDSVQAERNIILNRIRHHQSEAQAWRTHSFSKTMEACNLLEQVAELHENALLQQEVLRHASRAATWQICSPDTMARGICHSWPAFPDVLGILKAIAAMPANE